MTKAKIDPARHTGDRPQHEAEWADHLLKQVALFEKPNAAHRVEGERLSGVDGLWLTLIFVVLPCLIAAAMWMLR